MSDILPYRILIDMDAIMDTLMGSAVLDNVDNLEALIANGYHNRYHDQLSMLVPSINDNRLALLRKEKPKQVLMASRPSLMVYTLNEMILAAKIGRDNNPYTEDSSVHINYYPYPLTDSEVEEFIGGFQALFGIDKVYMFSMAHSNLKPNIIASDYEHYICYDINRFLENHVKVLDKDVMRNVTVTFPIRVKGQDAHNVTEEHIDLIRTQLSEIFKADTVLLGDISYVAPYGSKK